MNLLKRLRYAADALSGRLPLGNSLNTYVGGSLISNMQNIGHYVKNGYSANGTIYTIVSFCARKFATVPLHIYEVANDNEFKRYKSLTPANLPTTPEAMHQALKARKKALNIVESHPLTDLLKRPNPTQGGASFFENLFGFKMITGAGTAWANRGRNSKGEWLEGEPLELWCLPSQDISILVDHRDCLVPIGYQLNSGYISNLRKGDVLYWKYWNPNWSIAGEHLYGLSPLKAGEMFALTRAKADERSATMMQNQGTKGVLFAKGEDGMSEDERDMLRLRIDEEVNGKRNTGRVALANTDLGYINLGMSGTDMGIEGIQRMSKEDLCGVFGAPFTMFDSSRAIQNNVDSSMKGFVTNKIIPEWCGLRDDLNAWLLPMYKNGHKFWIEPDFSALPEMQKDLEKQVNSLTKLWMLTPNQVLDQLGWEVNDNDENMNKVYIPANLVPLDQLNADPLNIDDDIDSLDSNGLSDYKR